MSTRALVSSRGREGERERRRDAEREREKEGGRRESVYTLWYYKVVFTFTVYILGCEYVQLAIHLQENNLETCNSGNSPGIAPQLSHITQKYISSYSHG